MSTLAIGSDMAPHDPVARTAGPGRAAPAGDPFAALFNLGLATDPAAAAAAGLPHQANPGDETAVASVALPSAEVEPVDVALEVTPLAFPILPQDETGDSLPGSLPEPVLAIGSDAAPDGEALAGALMPAVVEVGSEADAPFEGLPIEPELGTVVPAGEPATSPVTSPESAAEADEPLPADDPEAIAGQSAPDLPLVPIPIAAAAAPPADSADGLPAPDGLAASAGRVPITAQRRASRTDGAQSAAPAPAIPVSGGVAAVSAAPVAAPAVGIPAQPEPAPGESVATEVAPGGGSGPDISVQAEPSPRNPRPSPVAADVRRPAGGVPVMSPDTGASAPDDAALAPPGSAPATGPDPLRQAERGAATVDPALDPASGELLAVRGPARADGAATPVSQGSAAALVQVAQQIGPQAAMPQAVSRPSDAMVARGAREVAVHAARLAPPAGQPVAAADPQPDVAGGSKRSFASAPDASAPVRAPAATPSDGGAGAQGGSAQGGEGSQTQAQQSQSATAAPRSAVRAIIDARAADFDARLTREIAGAVRELRGGLEISLRPKNLGTLKIRIELAQDRAQVQITTETAAAARLIGSGEERLSQMLDQAGIRLGAMVAQAAGQGTSGGGRGGDRGQKAGALGAASDRKATAARGAETDARVRKLEETSSSINLIA
jgi:hypothetical protein